MFSYQILVINFSKSEKLQIILKINNTIHREECVGFCCLNKNCSENRLCCQKCLQQYHQYHTNEIIILDALEEFISNSSKNVKQVIATSKNRFECVKESIDSLIYKLENKIYGLESSIQKLNTSQLEELIKYSFQYEELEQILKSSFDELTNHIQKTLEGIYLNYSLQFIQQYFYLKQFQVYMIEYNLMNKQSLNQEMTQINNKFYEWAKEYFEQCIQINPKNSTALLGIANCLYQFLFNLFIRENKKYKEAEQYYTKVKLLDESNINIFCGLGECLGFLNLLFKMIRQQMQIEKALIQFDEALRIDPSFSQAAFYKGVLLIYQGIWRVLQNGENEELVKEEIFTYFKNITLNDNDTYLCFQNKINQFMLISLDGYPEDAEQIIEEVVKITPNNYEGLLIKSYYFSKRQVSCQLIITIFELYLVSNNLAQLYNYLDRQRYKIYSQHFLRVYAQSFQFIKRKYLIQNNTMRQLNFQILFQKVILTIRMYIYLKVNAQYFQIKMFLILKLKKPKEALQIFYSILEINPKHKDALECKDQCLEIYQNHYHYRSDRVRKGSYIRFRIKNLMKNLLKYIFKLDIHYFSIIYKTCLFSTSVYQFQQ